MTERGYVMLSSKTFTSLSKQVKFTNINFNGHLLHKPIVQPFLAYNKQLRDPIINPTSPLSGNPPVNFPKSF